MAVSEKLLKELKEILEKDHKREFSDAEVEEAANTLAGLAEIAVDSYFRDKEREKKLKESPKGFILESHGYTCAICGSGTPLGENWYDKWGIKCSVCQDSINRKEIPPSLAKFKDSWYSKYEIESRFNIKGSTLTSFIKKGILKSRPITYGKGKRVHTHLFLIKDNKDTLPPKDMVKSVSWSEEKDGKTWFRSEPWYKFGNPHEKLKGYKIMNYLKLVEKKDV